MKKKFIELLMLILIISALIILNNFYMETITISVVSMSNYFTFTWDFWGITINLLTIIMASLVLFTAIVILLERRDPSRTLAWLLILIFIPVIGFALYLTFGRKFRKRRVTAKKKQLNDYVYPLYDTYCEKEINLSHITKSKEGLIQLICNNADFPLTLNNEVMVLTDGQQVFSAFIAALESAKNHIHLETYILRNDNIGNRIISLLLKKRKEGVSVRVIYDGLGSRELEDTLLNELKEAGIEIEPFFPVKFTLFHSKINYRNHRKILIVDGRIGFVGGLNIGDEYLGRDPNIGYWRDTHLQIEGNAVYFLQRIFLQDWYFITHKTLENSNNLLFPTDDKLLAEPQAPKIVQITASGPDTHWESIMQVFYYSIATAKKSVYLTSPYFIPNESILTAIKTAALGGVEVKLLLPAKPDHRIVFWAAMSYLEEIMEAGVEVYLYQKGFIHAKVLTVDGVVSTIGSANMDQRSFQLNFEVNALVYNEAVTRRLERDFWNDLEYSQKIDLDVFKNRGITKRFIESSARLFSPLL